MTKRNLIKAKLETIISNHRNTYSINDDDYHNAFSNLRNSISSTEKLERILKCSSEYVYLIFETDDIQYTNYILNQQCV